MFELRSYGGIWAVAILLASPCTTEVQLRAQDSSAIGKTTPNQNRDAKGRSRRELLANVTQHRDLEYATANAKKLLLDIYVPKVQSTETHPLPLIVWIHGGAWQAGSKNNCPALRMTQQGYVVASISYRLSQEAIFPAQIEDCKAAIRWLRKHAAEYKIDPKRIGVWGSSAGGHLVALLGTSGGVKDLEQEHGHLDGSSRVQAVCDFFGPTDFLRMDEDALPGGPIQHNEKNSPESKLIGGAIQENPEKVARANPITYISTDDPPFLIIHGDRDPLVPWQQSKYLHDALTESRLDASLHIIPGAGHGFGANREVEKLVDDFFARTLKPPRD
jgi:acetyl esterase/lipase